jgi:hypothetical protein
MQDGKSRVAKDGRATKHRVIFFDTLKTVRVQTNSRLHVVARLANVDVQIVVNVHMSAHKSASFDRSAPFRPRWGARRAQRKMHCMAATFWASSSSNKNSCERDAAQFRAVQEAISIDSCKRQNVGPMETQMWVIHADDICRRQDAAHNVIPHMSRKSMS